MNDNLSNDEKTPLVQQVSDNSENFKEYMFGLESDWMGIVLAHVRELFAGITFLLCISRVGGFDYFATPIILFFVLVTYGMPFLNPAVWLCLRGGPYYNSKNPGRTWFTIIVLLLFQLVTGMIAAAIRNSLDDTFGQEALAISPVSKPFYRHTGYPTMEDTPDFASNGAGIKSMILLSPNNTYDYNCSRVTPYPYEDNVACHTNGVTWGTWTVLEEIADSFFFCVGVIYLFRVVERMNNDERQMKLRAGVKGSDAGPDDTSTIPLILAAFISLLALGLNYAFPTASHGVHVTLFRIWQHAFKGKHIPDELNMRMLGGFLGGLIAYGWYMARYYWDAWLNGTDLQGQNRSWYSVDRNTRNNRGLLYNRMTMRKTTPGLTAVYIPRSGQATY